jgi:hypothetical protein
MAPSCDTPGRKHDRYLSSMKELFHPLDSFSFSCYIFPSNRNETVS